MSNGNAFAKTCFTVSRFGAPTEGIQLETDPGSDQFRPLPARIMFGQYFIQVDARHPPIVEDGLLNLAVVNRIVPKKGRSFMTLAQPQVARPGTSIVLVDTNLSIATKFTLKVNDVPVRLYSGTSGGCLIERDQNLSLVELSEGETLTVFFEDGSVRKFRRQGQKLEESFVLTVEETLTERILEAVRLLDRSKGNHNAQKFVTAVIQGMINLVQMTIHFNQRGQGQDMRMRILQEFFLKLDPAQRKSCFGRLGWILSDMDPALSYMLRDYGVPATDESTGGHEKVTNIAERRVFVEDLTAEQREARKEANRLHNDELKAKKEAEQAKFRAKRQAQKAPAPAKQNKNKKKRGQKQEEQLTA